MTFSTWVAEKLEANLERSRERRRKEREQERKVREQERKEDYEAGRKAGLLEAQGKQPPPMPWKENGSSSSN